MWWRAPPQLPCCWTTAVELDAWIVGSDTRTDLAVVKITADGLVPASFGDSDILQVGERAVAIGNAAGQLSGTVTQGIISGLNREISMQAGNSVVTMNLYPDLPRPSTPAIPAARW